MVGLSNASERVVRVIGDLGAATADELGLILRMDNIAGVLSELVGARVLVPSDVDQSFSLHPVKDGCSQARARSRLRASMWAESVRAGFAVGCNADALRALRDRSPDLLPEPALPHLLRRLFCPACWTRLSADLTVEYDACPNCGHGLSLEDVEAPFGCTDCDFINDGPLGPIPHFATRAGDFDGSQCDGALVARPYLPYDVAWTASRLVVLLVEDSTRDTEEQLRQLPRGRAGRPLPIVVRTIHRTDDDGETMTRGSLPGVVPDHLGKAVDEIGGLVRIVGLPL